MAEPQNTITFAEAFEETEKELKNNLPPWNKASTSQKTVILFLKAIIYFPVAILISLIVSSYAIYIVFYIVEILRNKDNVPEVYYWQNDSEKKIALIKVIVLGSLMTLSMLILSISLYRASTTDPGTIPKEAEWEFIFEDSSESSTERPTREKRKDGTLRACNHCQLKKPDRCHHCKQCDRCNLRMDHHCNWIANCVGNNNYKYFYLLIFYGSVCILIFVASFWETVVVAVCDDNSSDAYVLFIVTSYSLLFLLSFAVVGFWIFHTWLIYRNYTTIEFCEKRRNSFISGESLYSISVLDNFKEALGQNPWLWLLPLGYDKSPNSGLHFNIKNN